MMKAFQCQGCTIVQHEYIIVFIPFELFSASDSEDEGSIKGDIYKRQTKIGSGNLFGQLFVCVNVPTCTHPSHT